MASASDSAAEGAPASGRNVIIVGGGPAGLFAALALKQAGLSPTLVAPAMNGPGDPRSSALLGGSVRALERLGVWSLIADKAAPLRLMRLVDDTGGLIRGPLFEGRCEEIGLDAFGYNLLNDDLNRGLKAAVEAAGIPVIADKATEVSLDAEAARVRLGSGATLSAPVIAGADGRASIVRAAAGIDAVATRYPQTAVTANFRHSRPHDDASTEFHTKSGPFTLVPLPGDRSSLVCVVTPAEADRLLAMDDISFSREIERRSQAILGKVTVEPGRGRFELSAMTPRSFAGRRAVLIGEAAHVIPPIGAQGLNLGLRDGAALADILADALATGTDIGSADVVAAYDRARRADVVARTFAVDALNRSLLSRFLPVQALRGAGLWLMDRVGPVRRAFMREGLSPSMAEPRLMRADVADAA